MKRHGEKNKPWVGVNKLGEKAWGKNKKPWEKKI